LKKPAALAPLLVALGAGLVWIFAAELAARSWVERRGDPLDRALSVLELDARLGWRQRAGLDRLFYGHPLRTNELGLRDRPLREAAAARRRILVLGPSSTFGWGVAEEETYARRLERLLQDVAVVNAGEIGYSVWQGLSLYRDGGLRALKPDVVVIAYGLNDVDRYRFAFDSPEPDEAALGRGQSAASVRVQNLFGRLLCLQAARRRLLLWAGRALKPAAAFPEARPGLRVPLPDFQRLLLELVRLARADGARVVLLTSAYHAPGRPDSAGAEVQRIRKDLEAVNGAVLSLARAERLPVVDAARLLSGNGADALFVDPAHPSAEGHARIARDLLRAVRAALR
jgi:lysophospholipase L1-like esterase